MMILVYVTHENMEKAEKMASVLLEKRLIACANCFPIQALSWWTGKIEKCGEAVSIFKARKEHWKKLRDTIQQLHPYQVPCILKIDVEANEAYANWVQKETEQR